MQRAAEWCVTCARVERFVIDKSAQTLARSSEFRNIDSDARNLPKFSSLHSGCIAQAHVELLKKGSGTSRTGAGLAVLTMMTPEDKVKAMQVRDLSVIAVQFQPLAPTCRFDTSLLFVAVAATH
jgi:hypothetical protein